jgi:hypothetical protein
LPPGPRSCPKEIGWCCGRSSSRACVSNVTLPGQNWTAWPPSTPSSLPLGLTPCSIPWG